MSSGKLENSEARRESEVKSDITKLSSVNRFDSLEILKGCCTQGCCEPLNKPRP